MDLSLGHFGVLAALGVFGGALTTLAGMGGGLFLVITVGLLFGPTAALAITSPALLVSNVHRATLFRSDVRLAIVSRFAMGTLPAAIVAGFFAAKLPPVAIQLATLGLTGFAVLRATGVVSFAPGPRLFVPLSAGIGVLASGTGVGGFLAAPLLIALGLSGAPYVATAAACSVVLHASRIIGYGAGGLLTTHYATLSLALFAGLAVGNVTGRSLRGWLTPRSESRLELSALVLCAILGIFGVGAR